MANRRLANSITRKLAALDQKISDEWEKFQSGKCSIEKVERYEAQRVGLVTEAKTKGLRMIAIPVADGVTIYWETKRTCLLATFEWLYGGPDKYVSPWGDTVAIPLKAADKRLSAFRPEETV